MFAMLHGALPALPGDDPLRAVVDAQVEAGLELVTEAGALLPDRDAAILGALAAGDTGPRGLLVRTWQATAEAVRLAAGDGSSIFAAATITGPYSLSARTGSGDAAAIGEALAGELVALAAAGCPLVVVDEPEAVGIGADEGARTRFRGGAAGAAPRRPSAPRDAGAHRRVRMGGGAGDDPRGAVRLVPARPDRGPGQLGPRAGGARRPGDRVRGASGAVGRRPGLATRVGRALRGVDAGPRARARRARERVVAGIG